jgi:hypothetical protein
MSDTARDYQTIQSTAVEGLDDFFSADETVSGPSQDDISDPSQALDSQEATGTRLEEG